MAVYLSTKRKMNSIKHRNRTGKPKRLAPALAIGIAIVSFAAALFFLSQSWKLQARLDELGRELEKTKLELEQTARQLQEAQGELALAQASLAVNQDRLAEVSKQLEETKSRLEEAESQVSQLIPE